MSQKKRIQKKDDTNKPKKRAPARSPVDKWKKKTEKEARRHI